MSSMLYQEIEQAYEYVNKPDISDSIINNLKYRLREYQKEALSNFIFYESVSKKHKDLPHKHLLFHMATGSGKTNIIASVILYLYEKGYRDFIFFVDSNNIISKTKENLLNRYSSKYLYKPNIYIGSKEVFFNEITDSFDSSKADDINILFTTINKLHIDLETTIKENSITYEDFKDRKIVMIADEAHHLNANTKTEKESEKNWERTTQNLLTINESNILLEFTATQDLQDSKIAKKYKDKIIYDYTLKKFRDDGYSKEIKLISDNFDDKKRMLQAVMISEYRRLVAQRNLNLSLKPVILFKSVKNTVDADSKFEMFISLIEDLSIDEIDDIFKSSNIDAIKQLEGMIDDKEQFIKQIQYGFGIKNSLVIHSKIKDKEQKLRYLNSLEELENPIRAIFAVDILNEGWDVLNLFDIVKLDEAKKTKTSTVSEAQLIGRGARYFPFEYEDSDIYKRKFDEEPDNPLTILEEMYFHSINQSDYINAITQELRRIGLIDESDEEPQTVTLKVKESFLNHIMYKKGLLYVNKKVEQKRDDIDGIGGYVDSYKIQKRYIDNQSSEMSVYDDEVRDISYSCVESFSIKDIESDLVRLAINQNPFFYFANLKKYFVHLRSVKEFIEDDNYLGGVVFTLHTTEPMRVSDDIKLKYISELLSYIEKEIIKNAKEYVGSCEFYPVRINQQIPAEKKLKLKDSDSPIHRDEEWYIFEPHNGTSEEKHFTEFIKSVMSELKKAYDNVWLIRNEKAVDIYSFDKSLDGAKFEPDFILLLQDKQGCFHQVFCEPKGEHLLKHDSWKEEFLNAITQCTSDSKLILRDINDKSLPLYDNLCYKVWGLPLYNNALEDKFQESFKEVIFSNITPYLEY